jgi:hypothetical protein
MQMLVPASLKEDILKLYHDCLSIPFQGVPPLHFPTGALFVDLEGLRAAHESHELQYLVTSSFIEHS